MSSVVNYFQAFYQGDPTIPSLRVQEDLSKVLDEVVKKTVNEFTDVLRLSQEHSARVSLLNKQPTRAGNFAFSKIIFDRISPFEQMVALADFLGQKAIRTDHTFFFAVPEDEYIPIYVKKYASTPANPMHVRLGSTKGSHKAPKYAEWAQQDPVCDSSQKIFIAPLQSLEIVRQPHFSAATVIKAGAFDNNKINSAWRYGSEYACVEDKGQSSGGVSKESLKKRCSAGLNMTALTSEGASYFDPYCEELDICPPFYFADYDTDDYFNEPKISISPGDLIKASEKSIDRGNDEDLTRYMENLVIANIGIPSTPSLAQHMAQKIKENNLALQQRF